MRKTWMIGGIGLLLTAGLYQEIYTNVAGAPAARSGGAGEQNCTNGTCHTGTLNAGSGQLSITSNAPNNEYTPGQTYTITVNIAEAGIARFGFEVLTGYNASANASQGTNVVTNATETQQKSFQSKRYITHRTAGTLGSGSRTWTFDWTAPDPGTGDLFFYVCANSTNNNNARTGDLVYTSSMMLSQGPVAVDPAVDFALTYGPNPVQNQLNLRVENPAGPVSAQAFDAQGREVAAWSIPVEGTAAVADLDMSQLQAGVYFIQVKAGDKQRTVRILHP